MINTPKYAIITGMALSCLLLSGCANNFWVYKVDVQQGNSITAQMRQQIKLGMSRAEVERLMGEPVLVDTFNTDRYNYVYYFRDGKAHVTQQKLTVVFRNDTVVRIFNQ